MSSKSAVGAELLSYIAAFGCILMAIPPIMIGMVAKSTSEYLQKCVYCVVERKVNNTQYY